MRVCWMCHLLLFGTLVASEAKAQTTAVPANNPLGGLTPVELEQFAAASQQFTSHHIAESLPLFKELIKAHPENRMLAKYGSEAAIDTADWAFATATLKPIEAAHPEDWQAAVLMARVYTGEGDKAGRDHEIAHLLELHRQGVTPGSMKQYIVETIHLPDGKTLTIYNSFEPWGIYKVYNYGQILDAERKMAMRITLESSDSDQPQYAKEHPAEAAAGTRRFSLDGYRAETPQAGGQATDTHFTYGFLDGRPSYEELRAAFVAIAEGKKQPISSRSGLPASK